MEAEPKTPKQENETEEALAWKAYVEFSQAHVSLLGEYEQFISTADCDAAKYQVVQEYLPKIGASAKRADDAFNKWKDANDKVYSGEG